MDFRRIQHFINIAELGSVSKAAARLNVVQPALSQSTKRLEAELGVLLFARSRKGMELTEAGHTFLEYAYGILNQFNRAKESLSNTTDKPEGKVSVAMTASALHVLTVPVCQYLADHYPDIKLNIEAGLAGNIQQGFEAGQYDLVLSYLTEPNDSIHREELIREDFFLVTPYDPGNEGADIFFSELNNLPLIIPQEQHGVRAVIMKHAMDQKIKIFTAQVSGALHPTLQLVEAGFGNSLVPWSAIYDRVAQKRLSARKIVDPCLHHTVSMIYPTHRPLTPATVVVMDAIRYSAVQAHNSGSWSGQMLIREHMRK